MEKELALIDMLGYKIKQIYETRWNVLDENDKIVGFIQKKKIHSKDIKKNLPAVFGYITKIDSDKIIYNDKTIIGDENNFNYSFDIKVNGDNDYVEMNIKYPSITLWSKEYGFISFHLTYNNLFFNYKSKTDKFNIEECVSYKWDKERYGKDDNKEFIYDISFCDKKFDIDATKSRRSLKISAKHNPDNKNSLDVEERTLKANKLINHTKSESDLTMYEFIEEHKMGIDSFDHLRYIFTKALPFKQEFFSTVFENYGFSQEELLLFFPDVVREKQLIKQF